MESPTKNKSIASNGQSGAGLLEVLVGGSMLVVIASFGYKSLKTDMNMLSLSASRIEAYTNVAPLQRGIEGALLDETLSERVCPSLADFSIATLSGFLSRPVYSISEYTNRNQDSRIEQHADELCQNSHLCVVAPSVTNTQGADAMHRGDILLGLDFGAFNYTTLSFRRCLNLAIEDDSEVAAVRYRMLQFTGQNPRPIIRHGMVKDPAGVRAGEFQAAAITIPGPPNFDGVVNSRSLFRMFPMSFPSLGERRMSFRILRGSASGSIPGFRIGVPYECTTADPADVPTMSECSPCFALNRGTGSGSEPVTAEQLLGTNDVPENLANFYCDTFQAIIVYSGRHQERR